MDTSPLGNKTSYKSIYDKSLLYPIAREIKRSEIGINSALPFTGYDVWNAYELSWLNSKGKPQVAIGDFVFAAESENIIESKSFKLYLNSFNNTHFDSLSEVRNILKNDLSEAAGCNVSVKLIALEEYNNQISSGLTGTNIDHIDITVENLELNKHILETEESIIHEKITSDLLKSNCLVTSQPDWASIYIEYEGKKINHESLLKYIISFRNHNEFHEQCVERIFYDIKNQCKPQELTVYARYTRRGGLDINPYRTTKKDFSVINTRLNRQ